MTQIQKAANDLRNKREKQLVELRTEIAQDIVNLMQEHGKATGDCSFLTSIAPNTFQPGSTTKK